MMNFDINKKFNPIILASGSPRRIEILSSAGVNPIILSPDCAENLPENIGMQDAVMFLALKKALWAEESIRKQEIYQQNPLIIAADTIVYHKNIIGKPKDKKDALHILSELSGDSHDVATGVALLVAGSPQRRVFCDITKVFFKSYTAKEISAYLDTDEPYDKAGAYAIQGTFSQYIDRIEGDLNNVIGFPLSKVIEEMNFIC